MALKPQPTWPFTPVESEGNATLCSVTKAESSGVPPSYTGLFEMECGEVSKAAEFISRVAGH